MFPIFFPRIIQIHDCEIGEVSFSNVPAVFDLKTVSDGMGHLVGNLLERNLALVMQFEHGDERMLDEWTARRGIGIRHGFFFHRMRSMVGCDNVDASVLHGDVARREGGAAARC